MLTTTISRTPAKTKVDVSAFVSKIREVNKIATNVINTATFSSKGSQQHLRQELVAVLDELSISVKALRVAAVANPSAPDQTQAASQLAKDHTTFVLDSTPAMLEKRQLVSALEFQSLMGWRSRQAVWKAVKDQRIFYLTYKAERYFPTLYCDPSYERKHLEAVSQILGDLPGGAKLQFFLTRKGSLGGATPLQALADGRFSKVKDIAAAFAEVPSRG
jgi:hypothetical protein